MTRRLRLYRPVALAIATVVVLAAAGCGDDDASSDDGTPSAGGSSSAGGGSTSGADPSPLEIRVVSATSAVGAPDSQTLADFEALRCSDPPTDVPPTDPLTACSIDRVKYALEPAAVSTVVEDATAEVPAGQSQWAVNVALDDAASADLEALSRKLTRTHQRGAFVVDGVVVTAPGFDGVITGGQLQISAGFTEEQAKDLAASLTGS